MQEEILNKILQRLNILLAFKIQEKFDGSTDVKKIGFLDSFGLRPVEIAEIMGSTGDKISKQLYKVRNKKK